MEMKHWALTGILTKLLFGLQVQWTTPYLPYYIGEQCRWAVSVGGEEFQWRHPVHHQLWSQQRYHCSLHSTAKTNDKSTFLRKNDLSYVVSLQ